MSRRLPIALAAPALCALSLLACSGKDDASPTDRTLEFDTSIPVVDSEPIEPVASCRDQAVTLGPETCVSEAPCAWSGGHSYEFFGASLSVGGDVDGDGVTDIAVGAPGFEPERGTDEAINDAGRVVFISGASLLASEAPGELASLHGAEPMGWLGSSVAIVGDVNGDGVDDTWAGAMGAPVGELSNAGVVTLVLGQAGGWGEDGQLSAAASFGGEAEYSRAGFAIEPGGDVDGDGLADVWITGNVKRFDGSRELSSQGTVYLLLGRSEGWATGGSLADADASVTGAGSADELGRAVAGGADLNGDGHVDLIAAAPYANSTRGVVYGLPGGAEAFSRGMVSTEAALQVSGLATYDYLGYDLATGDFNGDGVADLAVGVPLSDLGEDGGGEVRLYAGGPDFFDGADPIATLYGDQEDGQLGAGVNSGGDLDGDGFDDLALGAVLTWHGLVTKGGRSVVLRGRDADWPQGASISTVGEVIHGATVKDYLGDVGAIGDLDGDGRAELLLSTSYANVSGSYDVGALYLFWGL